MIGIVLKRIGVLFLYLGYESDEKHQEYRNFNMNRRQSDGNGRMQTDSLMSVVCLHEDICEFVNQCSSTIFIRHVLCVRFYYIFSAFLLHCLTDLYALV